MEEVGTFSSGDRWQVITGNQIIALYYKHWFQWRGELFTEVKSASHSFVNTPIFTRSYKYIKTNIAIDVVLPLWIKTAVILFLEIKLKIELVLLVSIWAKTENPLLFCVPEVTKLTLMLFFEGIDLSHFLFFCISAISEHLSQNLGSEYRTCRKFDFPSKN